MKSMNFNVIEILPSLLDKSKTQTIRKAWKEVEPTPFLYTERKPCGAFVTKDITTGIEQENFGPHPEKIKETVPPKYKVGDKVDVVWNEDSDYNFFHRGDGEPYTSISQIGSKVLFNKHLGKVEIAEVFKIEMGKVGKGYYIAKGNAKVTYYDLKENITLSERDGFKSAEEMFKVLDKLYDLKEPKEFWIYRFRWL